MKVRQPYQWFSGSTAAIRLGIPFDTLRKRLERHSRRTRYGIESNVDGIVGRLLTSRWRVNLGDTWPRARLFYSVADASQILDMSTGALRKMLERRSVNGIVAVDGISARKRPGQRWRIQLSNRWLRPDGTPSQLNTPD